ncbi:hypothetical protein [Streptomyces apocyni]|uniref:hypothetical protein n=1 Tax=Streptomyces apocyni TaxID=2654677 RepID=UPI001E56B8EC|nr:hypothetical protein [Streptomyces apocyni]
MRRALTHGAAWACATAAAVTLSWWGVHTVMSGTAYDRPRALPIAGLPQDDPTEGSRHGDDDRPQSDSTRRPQESATASATERGTPPPKDDKSRATDRPSSGASADGASGRPSRTPDSGASPSATATASTGTVKGYTAAGGRVVFDIGESSAELVSATPNSGWQMQVWKQPKWIRVTFTRGDREVSVFCTWHNHAPLVEIDER